MKCKLKDVCFFRKEKTDITVLTTTYISTENMISNKL